jgi:hypothetical protein
MGQGVAAFSIGEERRALDAGAALDHVDREVLVVSRAPQDAPGTLCILLEDVCRHPQTPARLNAVDLGGSKERGDASAGGTSVPR